MQSQIRRMLFERTAVSKKHEDLIRVELDALRDEDRLTPDLVFRDPYFLDFLGLPEGFTERDLEQGARRHGTEAIRQAIVEQPMQRRIECDLKDGRHVIDSA